MKVLRHISATISKAVHGVMSEWKVLQVISKIDGKHGRAPEGTSALVVANEIFYYYFLYKVKVHKSSVSEKI